MSSKQLNRLTAGVAYQQHQDFRRDYRPLLLGRRDDYMRGSPAYGHLGGRANADLMQGLGNPSLMGALDPFLSRGVGRALASSLGDAAFARTRGRARDAANILAGARNQQMTSQRGLSAAADTATRAYTDKVRSNTALWTGLVSGGLGAWSRYRSGRPGDAGA